MVSPQTDANNERRAQPWPAMHDGRQKGGKGSGTYVHRIVVFHSREQYHLEGDSHLASKRAKSTFDTMQVHSRPSHLQRFEGDVSPHVQRVLVPKPHVVGFFDFCHGNAYVPNPKQSDGGFNYIIAAKRLFGE